MSDIND